MKVYLKMFIVAQDHERADIDRCNEDHFCRLLGAGDQLLEDKMMTSSNGNFSALLAICAGNSPVTGEFPHKGQWRGALIFSLICVWINDWVINNREAGDLRRHRGHYDVTVMNTEDDIGENNEQLLPRLCLTVISIYEMSMIPLCDH